MVIKMNTGNITMEQNKSLSEYKHYLESLPIFVILDNQYFKNKNSSIFESKPADMQYVELVNKLNDILVDKLQANSRESVRELPFTTIFSIAEMIIYSAVKSTDVFQQVMKPEYALSYLPCHSLNVTFISAKIGMGLQLSFDDLSKLCVAALLHDVGMTQLPPNLYESKEVLTPEQRKAIESHPLLGYQFFEKIKNDFPWLLKVILETHKRENNKGYPDIVTDELHLYSKIVGIADTFEALTHNRSFRKAYHPADAIKTIIGAKEDFFAMDILRSTIDSLGLYPVGSLIQLNNKKIAAVIDTTGGSPMRPIVEIVNENQLDNSAKPVQINLNQDNNLYITGLVYSEMYEGPEKIRKVQ